jgi:hypothetical protein
MAAGQLAGIQPFRLRGNPSIGVQCGAISFPDTTIRRPAVTWCFESRGVFRSARRHRRSPDSAQTRNYIGLQRRIQLMTPTIGESQMEKYQ